MFPCATSPITGDSPNLGQLGAGVKHWHDSRMPGPHFETLCLTRRCLGTSHYGASIYVHNLTTSELCGILYCDQERNNAKPNGADCQN